MFFSRKKGLEKRRRLQPLILLLVFILLVSFIIIGIKIKNVKSYNSEIIPQAHFSVMPSSPEIPGRVNFTVYVPSTKNPICLKICFTQQNGLECKQACKDSILVIKINNQTLFNDVVFDWEGKVCKYIPLREFKGKKITLTILDYAGGVCSKWCGEGVKLIGYPEIVETC